MLTPVDDDSTGQLVDVPYHFVKSNEALANTCRDWQNAEFLALDTEFIRTNTFYPKVGLIQVSDGIEITLIDPLTIDEWKPFSLLMSNQNIMKIFHSCSEDLLVFFSFLNVLPQPIFDTQVGSALADNNFGISYQNLVKNSHGVDLPKGETRSDWLQRPLTPEQLSYAALDVYYLPEIYQSQLAKLQELQREQWLIEECGKMLTHYETEFSKDFSSYYLNIKGAWQLTPVQLATLQQLAIWREEKARKRNKPRSWIIKDKPLYAIAAGMPNNKNYLSGIDDISENFIHYEGEKIIDLVNKTSALPESECPPMLPS